MPSACLELGLVSRIRPLTYSLSFSVTRPSNLVVSHSLYVAPYFASGPLIYWRQASEIGFCLAIAGFISCVIQLFVTPILLTRCDHVRVYNRCISLWPYCFLALPLLNMVARSGLPMMDHQVREEVLRLTDVDHRVQSIVWCGIAALLALSRLGCLAFAWVDAYFALLIRRLKCCNISLSMILVNENAPTPDSLGATNGLVQFAMCFTRSFCPAFARYVDDQT